MKFIKMYINKIEFSSLDRTVWIDLDSLNIHIYTYIYMYVKNKMRCTYIYVGWNGVELKYLVLKYNA
jgi:hypothetical protein